MSSTYKYIKIGGHKVKVLWDSDSVRIGDRMGSSWTEHNSIQINTNFPKSQQEVTLLHEIIHHIMFNWGYKLGEEPHTEQLVESLSQGLYQVLKDNNIVFKEK